MKKKNNTMQYVQNYMQPTCNGIYALMDASPQA